MTTTPKPLKAPVTRERVHRTVKLTGAAAVVAAAGAVGAFCQTFIGPARADVNSLASVEKRLTVVETTQQADAHRLERMEDKLDRIWERIRK